MTAFTSLDQIREYVGGDRIECLICHKQFQTLDLHLRFKEGVTPAAYRERFGIPRAFALISEASRLRRAASYKLDPARLRAYARLGTARIMGDPTCPRPGGPHALFAAQHKTTFDAARAKGQAARRKVHAEVVQTLHVRYLAGETLQELITGTAFASVSALHSRFRRSGLPLRK